MIRPEHFTHLHSHSNFSVKDGCIPIRDLVDKQIELGGQAVACTDHGSMTGGWFLYDYIHNVKGYDVKPIIGLEAYLSLTRDELNKFRDDPKAIEDKDERAAVRKKLAKKYHQILLAKNKTGYFNLVKIHNDAWINGFYHSPATTKEIIFENAEGLITTTTCLASIWCQHIMDGNIQAAEKEIYEWKEVFGEDFYVELQPTNNDTQRLVNIELIKLANKTKTEMIVTNDVHYLDEGDNEFHYTLLNLDKLKKEAAGEDEQKKWEFSVDDLYMKSLDQMKSGWKKIHRSKEFPESVFDSCVMNVSNIVSKIESYSLESEPLLPSVSDKPPAQELKERVVARFKKMVQDGLIPRDKLQVYQDRLVKELKVIHMLNAEQYILVCNEVTDFCKESNIAVGPGRGSSSGSLILYVLGIVDCNPINHGLIFERFLNSNRRAMLKM